jgi:predicted nucleic acid-binding protein
MISYIDSSVVLSIIFQEANLENSVKIWKKSEIRVSSILLEAESKISIKRTFLNNRRKLGQTWKERKLIELDSLLEEINLKNLDSSTIENLNKEDTLSGCRTLDALHLSTAIEIQKELGEDLFIFSYDKEFIKVAKQLGFETL